MISTSPYAPWEPAFLVALPHGLCAGVHLPKDGEAAPESVLGRLHAAEQEHAGTLRGFRHVEFVGGRLAMGALFADLGLRRAPVLTDNHGAPALPEGVVGSVSHKRDLAIGLLARGTPGLGVDLEDIRPERNGIKERVLCPDELAAVDALAPERQWIDTVIRFSVKEALYKALHPFLQRYIGFGEVAVWPSPGGLAQVEPRSPDWAAFTFDARTTWIDDRVLSTVRVRPA